jgi:HK97 family phage major capsid protein
MAITTSTSATAWSPDITGTPASDVIPTALVMQITTQAGYVEGDAPYVRVPVVNDDEATVVPEGAPIPEAEPELSEALVQTSKVAKLLRLSREQFHQEGADQQLSDAAARSIITKADHVLLNGDDNAQGSGLLHQGIPDAGAVDSNLDVLVDAVATAQGNGAQPSNIVLAPDTWAALRKLKTTTDSAQSLLGVGTRDATSMLLGVPVLVNRAVPAGQGLIVDSLDIVSAIGDIESATSTDAYFSNDQIGLRATFRFGATVVHPNRHAVFSVATEGTE